MVCTLVKTAPTRYAILSFVLGLAVYCHADTPETIPGSSEQTLSGSVQSYVRTLGGRIDALGVLFPKALVFNQTLASVWSHPHC